MVNDQQYKYLVQGEYVEFALNELSTGKHKFQAIEISGIGKGQLMCETRREVRALRPKGAAKARGPGPREGDASVAQSCDSDVVDQSVSHETP